ncbi:hypothetical protein GYMLUDRAFT_415455 [Collybiopsis luxurians FD-317 M1]|nr:hypothetical protein GYMLUDRAFT_415455 [Collybiopsis luxurians FD-317 M1]
MRCRIRGWRKTPRMRRLYRWIIRDRLLGKKWRLLYLSAIASVPTDESSELMSQVNLDIMQNLQEDSTVALTGVPVDDWIANETAGPIVREKKNSLELTTISTRGHCQITHRRFQSPAWKSSSGTPSVVDYCSPKH